MKRKKPAPKPTTPEDEERLGDAVADFLQGPVFQWMVGCSEQDKKETIEQLLELDPFAFTTLVDLQNKIASIQRDYRKFVDLQKYLEDAINQGNEASAQLDSPGIEED